MSAREASAAAKVFGVLDAQKKERLKSALSQRITFLLVLIHENSKTSDMDTERNMFALDTSEVEGFVIHKSQKEITALTRTLIWLDSERAGLCDGCDEPMDVDSIDQILGARHCYRCSKPKQVGNR
jgi:RNA polymerase-binding transcription factor DksA